MARRTGLGAGTGDRREAPRALATLTALTMLLWLALLALSRPQPARSDDQWEPAQPSRAWRGAAWSS